MRTFPTLGMDKKSPPPLFGHVSKEASPHGDNQRESFLAGNRVGVRIEWPPHGVNQSTCLEAFTAGLMYALRPFDTYSYGCGSWRKVYTKCLYSNSPLEVFLVKLKETWEGGGP